MGHETVDDRSTPAEPEPLERDEPSERADDDYRGPDPEEDEKGDASPEDQGT